LSLALLQLCEKVLVKGVDSIDAVSLDVEDRIAESFFQKLENLLDQAEIELQKENLKVVVEELIDQSVDLPVDLLILA
jgi:hypothetical protein